MAVRFCRDGQDLFGLSTGIPRIPPADPGLGDSGQPPQVAQYTRSPISPTRQRLQAPQNAPPGLMSQLRMEKGWGKVLEACRSLPTDCHLPVFRLGMPAVDFAPFEEHLRATCGGMLASSDVPRRSNTTCCRFPTLGLPMYVPSPRPCALAAGQTHRLQLGLHPHLATVQDQGALRQPGWEGRKQTNHPRRAGALWEAAIEIQSISRSCFIGAKAWLSNGQIPRWAASPNRRPGLALDAKKTCMRAFEATAILGPLIDVRARHAK